MGELGEFPLQIRLFLKGYRWHRIDPIPWTPLRKPLGESKLCLVSSAGLLLPSQVTGVNLKRGEDPTFREIPSEIDVSSLVDTQPSRSFDHAGIRSDPNLAFPIDRVRELKEQGRIGSLSRNHLSFRGTITSTRRLIQETAPAAVRKMSGDGVDVALLIPV